MSILGVRFCLRWLLIRRREPIRTIIWVLWQAVRASADPKPGDSLVVAVLLEESRRIRALRSASGVLDHHQRHTLMEGGVKWIIVIVGNLV